MNLLLAVDPGGTTGFSWGSLDTGTFIEAGQLPPYEFCQMAHKKADSLRGNLSIVCERFTITARTLKVSRGGSYDALEVIGVLRYMSLGYCGRDLTFQQPADVMKLFDDERLRRLGWYQKGQGHANDSIRHLAYFLARAGKLTIPTTS